MFVRSTHLAGFVMCLATVSAQAQFRKAPPYRPDAGCVVRIQRVEPRGWGGENGRLGERRDRHCSGSGQRPQVRIDR
jgi:hypothetical protein